MDGTRPGLGFVEPMSTIPTKVPPSGSGWLHEIKHDGFCMMARRDAAGVLTASSARMSLIFEESTSTTSGGFSPSNGAAAKQSQSAIFSL
jgi:hypothetical protein